MQVGTPDMTPVACYLDIEGIIALAKAQHVDAIHPGYGACLLSCVACRPGCSRQSLGLLTAVVQASCRRMPALRGAARRRASPLWGPGQRRSRCCTT